MSDLVTTNPIQTIAPEPKENRVKNMIRTNTPNNIKDYWRTSDLAYNDACYLCGVFDFDIDLAAKSKNESKCLSWIDESEDFLSCDILNVGAQFAWLNPPFSKKINFIDKVYECSKGLSTCAMIPYEPCTAWFREHVDGKASVVFVPDGRYNFCHPETGEEIKGVNFACCFAVFNSLQMPTAYVNFKRGISAE